MTSPPNQQSNGDNQEIGLDLWLIAITVMLATFMVVLDAAIATVALPHIAGTPLPRHSLNGGG